MNDPYSVLGLTRDATPDDAKKAFKRLAKTCHPDLFPNDPVAEARFKEINAAYEAITKPEPAAQANPFQQGGFAFNFGTPFDDLFAHLHGMPRNADLQCQCRLTLEEAFTGKEVKLSLTPRGGAPRDITIQIPPGIEDGVRLCVHQAGDHSNTNVRPGDLYIHISITPHQRFTRTGRNLQTMVAVSAFDVLLRRTITVTGIDGQNLTITIPPRFDTTQKLRVAGHGMIDANRMRGDLLVELYIEFPPLSEQQRRLVEQVTTLS